VWPGLPRRPAARHVARDWLTKLQLVASGAAITTVPDVLLPALPSGVQALNVTDSPVERRRLLLCHIPRTATPESETVAAALRNAAVGFVVADKPSLPGRR
jgi:DNA-binding transcriptional LysR family regulator